MNKGLIEQYKILHAQKDTYGHGGAIRKILDDLDEYSKAEYGIKSVLDFGCGKGNLVKKIGDSFEEVVGYDPAIAEFSNFVVRDYDLVVSTDVFEHLDEDSIDEEINMILSLNPKYILLNIATIIAKNILPNGTNCHTIVWSAEIWIDFCTKKFPDYIVKHTRLDDRGASSVIIKMEKGS